MYDFNTLNDKQKLAVTVTEGPVLVVAGAGSGKTRALTFRIYNLIKNHNVNPQNILAITFTNKATKEMKNRLSAVDPNGQIQISTFHAFCARVLRQFIYLFDGYNKYFTIYNEDDKIKLIKKIISDLNINIDDFHKKSSSEISNAKNNGLSPQEYGQMFAYQSNIAEIVNVYAVYEEQMRKNNALDFDDLLAKTYVLLKANDSVLNYLQDMYRYIHIDEFQDTNIVQYKLVKLLAAKYKNIFVVGDEDQSIYGWRGASIENTNTFVTEFSPVIIKLEQNYRSTKSVLSHANKLICNNTSRIEKELWTDNDEGETVRFYKAYSDRDEAEFVVKSIYDLINYKNIKPSEIAILFRMGALSRLFEEKLLNYNIDYRLYGGFKFFDRVEVRNVLSYLWLVYNTNDNESIKRIINFPKRGIGKTSIEKLDVLSQEHEKSIYEIILNASNYDLSKSLVAKIESFANLLRDIKKDCTETKNMSQIFDYIVSKAGIRQEYQSNLEEDQNRLLNIGQLQESIEIFEKQNPDMTLADYLQSVALQTDQMDEQDEENAVRVSTIHAVKGLEFDAVFIVGAEEGLFPISRALPYESELQEERRLMYVAVTRSRKHLTISSSENRYLYNSRSNMLPSRFITEMGLIKPKVNTYATQGSGYVNFRNASFSNYNVSNSNYLSGDQEDTSSAANIYTENSINTNSGFTANMSKVAASTSNKFTDFKEGVKVLHPKYGEGIIVKREDLDSSTSVDVKFMTLGVKSFLLEYAPLKVV